jgi:hypothetical protein
LDSLLLVFAVTYTVFVNDVSTIETPPTPKPITRNFMVTECVKKVCLMKMRPHVKVTNPDGSYTWVKVQ